MLPKSDFTVAVLSKSISLFTPKILPVILLISINAIIDAKAPPALSLAHDPPMATANNICMLFINPHPIVSNTLDTP